MSKQQLYKDIVSLLKHSITSGEVSGDEKEQLEIAIDCISETFNVSDATANSNLLTIYQAQVKSTPAPSTISDKNTTVSDADKEAAQQLKSEGNKHIAKREFREAIECYTKAIEKDSTNAIFYANRAAAYAHLSQHDRAAEDARTATTIDPLYSKAWTRLGVALWAQGDAKGALDAYENGLKAEGDNPSEAMKRDYANVKKRYEEEMKKKQELDKVETKNTESTATREAETDSSQSSAGSSGGGFDFSQIMGMMQNPQVQDMMKNFASDPSALSSLLNSPMAQQMKEKIAKGEMPNLSDLGNLMK